VLIRALGRQDALPLGDLALRRAVSRVFFGGEDLSDVQVDEFAARWSPWRTYATVYLFTALRGGMV
jgi:DNA-3-methyladenine glycosylase II